MKTSNNEYKTNNESSVITKKDLKRMFWRSLPMEFSWHYERKSLYLQQNDMHNLRIVCKM